MKSVIQEGSSLAKAIEEGWEKAGKPVEFSVKIYQEAEYNFLGLGTKKKAKICIFFDESSSAIQEKRDFKKPVKVRELPSRPQHEKSDRPEQGRGDNKRVFKKTFEKRDRQPFRKDSPKPMGGQQSVTDSTKTEIKTERQEVDMSNKKVINAFVTKDK